MFTELTMKNFPQMAEDDDYIKELREKYPHQTYDVDPFSEVFKLKENVYVIRKESGDGHGFVFCYLIVGPQKAMLIDNGWGIGNLRGLAELLSDGKEIVPVIAWPHKMTSNGSFQFEKVYCHEYAAPVLEKIKNPESLKELCDENGNGVWVVCKTSDVIEYQEYEIVPCADGTVFDLGDGYEIEMIWTPGISPSGATYLDKTARVIYTGSLNARPHIDIGLKPRVMAEYRANEFATIPAFVDGLKKLQSRMDEFDEIYNIDSPLEVSRLAIPEWIALGKLILANPDVYDNMGVANSDHAKNVHFLERTFHGLSLTYNEKSCVVTK